MIQITKYAVFIAATTADVMIVVIIVTIIAITN